MVNGFDVKITMCNAISEKTSNLTMAFFRYLIAFLSRHLTDRCHFLLSDLEGAHINNQQSHFGTSLVTLQIGNTSSIKTEGVLLIDYVPPYVPFFID